MIIYDIYFDPKLWTLSSKLFYYNMFMEKSMSWPPLFEVKIPP